MENNPGPSASTEGEGLRNNPPTPCKKTHSFTFFHHCYQHGPHKYSFALIVPARRQSQHSDIAKIAINTRAATMAGTSAGPPPPPSPLANITNIDSHEFEIPKPAYKTFLTPPPTALGRALQAANMAGSQGFVDGVGHPPSDTPMGSAPSTAPSSPRM
jgi:6-phosphofructo-2-kinase